MKIRDVMQRACPAVGANYDAADVFDILVENRGRTVPVVDDAGHVMGMISVSDIRRSTDVVNARQVSETRRTQVNESGRRSVHAREVMSSPAICISPDAKLEEAVELFLDHEVGSIPVVADGRLVGMVFRSQMLGSG